MYRVDERERVRDSTDTRDRKETGIVSVSTSWAESHIIYTCTNNADPRCVGIFDCLISIVYGIVGGGFSAKSVKILPLS